MVNLYNIKFNYMFKQSKIFIFIEIIVLILVLFGVSYYFYKQRSAEKSPVAIDNTQKNFFVFNPQCSDLTLEQTDKLRERMNKAKEFLTKTPDHMGAWMEAGLIKKGICDYKGAEEVWIYVGELRPQNSLSFGNLGDLYTHFLKDYPKAEAAYFRAIENEKHDINYFRNFFELYYYSYAEKKYLAEKVLLDGIENNPESQDLMTLLASYYRDNGNKEKAAEYFAKALKINPDNSAIKQELEKLK